MSQIKRFPSDKKLPLTLDRVKETVKPFEKEDRIIYRSLIGMIDCYYHLALLQNKTEQEAIYAARDSLQKFIENRIADIDA